MVRSEPSQGVQAGPQLPREWGRMLEGPQAASLGATALAQHQSVRPGAPAAGSRRSPISIPEAYLRHLGSNIVWEDFSVIATITLLP